MIRVKSRKDVEDWFSAHKDREHGWLVADLVPADGTGPAITTNFEVRASDGEQNKRGWDGFLDSHKSGVFLYVQNRA